MIYMNMIQQKNPNKFYINIKIIRLPSEIFSLCIKYRNIYLSTNIEMNKQYKLIGSFSSKLMAV